MKKSILNIFNSIFAVFIFTLSLNTIHLVHAQSDPQVDPVLSPGVIDFEEFDLAGGTYLDVGSPLNFNDVDGTGVNVSIVEGADNRIYDLALFGNDPDATSQALIDWTWPEGTNPIGTTILFDQAVTNFKLVAGDFGGDDDGPLTITAYDASDHVIGTASAPWPLGQKPPFATLTIMASGIRKVVYHSGGAYANSTFIDNLTFNFTIFSFKSYIPLATK